MKASLRVIHHTPALLVVGVDSRQPRVLGALFVAGGVALIVFTKAPTMIPLLFAAFFIVSGIGLLRRSQIATATFDRSARVVLIPSEAAHTWHTPFDHITALRLVTISSNDTSQENAQRMFVVLEAKEGAVPIGFVSSPDDTALRTVQHFLALPRIERSDLGSPTGFRRFLVWTALTWGVSPTRLTALATHWDRAASRPMESRSCCEAQPRIDRAFCRECGSLLIDPAVGVRASLASRGCAALVEPMLVAAVVAFAWYSGTSLPDGRVSIGAIGSWALLAVPITYAVLWPGGSSPGKKLLGLRVVVFHSGRRPGFLRMAARELLGKTLSMMLLGSGFIVAAKDPDGRALHDRLFGTIVVARHRIAYPPVTPGIDQRTNELPAMR